MGRHKLTLSNQFIYVIKDNGTAEILLNIKINTHHIGLNIT